MRVLGIETSCDETAIAVVERGKKILANVVASSLHLHSPYGGVIPEIATRYHVERINFVLDQALRQAGVRLKDIDLVSCVYGPGLVGALLIGVSAAKALSLAVGKPLIGINHIQAHLYAGLMNQQRIKFPFVGLVVSGGHTNLFYVKDYLNWRLIGRTRDDAAGEAFDKTAKLLNLGYPGGPIIEKLAKQGDAQSIRFPRSYLEQGSLDFSFSGVKTAVLYHLRNNKIRNSNIPSASLRTGEIRNVAASFQQAVIDVLVDKSKAACRQKKVNNFVLGGGVACNQALRSALKDALNKEGINSYFPEGLLCQDNAAMAAGLAYQLYKKGKRSDLSLEVNPNLKI